MRFRLLLGILLVALIAACQGPPPTVIYIVISPTPETSGVIANAATEVVAVPTLASTIEQPSATIPPQETATPAPQATNTASPAPSATSAPATPAPTALPPSFPTPVITQIQVAEELFEHGRMFWIGPIDQIWVLTITSTGHGTWAVYQDTFKDGDPESDPSLVPPSGLYQPVRGFGKLWRESPGLRQALGWGVTPEFGYVSKYEYHAGGSVDADGKYVPGPGYHILYSLDGELFRFNEADGTWQLGNG